MRDRSWPYFLPPHRTSCCAELTCVTCLRLPTEHAPWLSRTHGVYRPARGNGAQLLPYASYMALSRTIRGGAPMVPNFRHAGWYPPHSLLAPPRPHALYSRSWNTTRALSCSSRIPAG